MSIINYIPIGKESAVTRMELEALTGLPDRTNRKMIEQARKEGNIIINDQDGKGYYQPSVYDLNAIERHYRQSQRRAKTILAEMKVPRRILKKAGRKV